MQDRQNVFVTSKSKRKKFSLEFWGALASFSSVYYICDTFTKMPFFSYYLRRKCLFSRTSWNLLDIFYVHLNIASYYFALKRVKSKKGNCIYSWPVSKRYQVYWIQFLINGLVYLWNLWTCSKRSDLLYVWKGLLPTCFEYVQEYKET